jgi:PhnB protein
LSIVKDVDQVFNQAVAAGARITIPINDAFWGNRYAKLTDPFGHSWSLATHIKNMTSEEMQKAREAAFAGMMAATRK